ncbi:hypothetical protein D3C71_1622280 [compost metagenome]
MAYQCAVQGIDPGEQRRPRLDQRVDQIIAIARIENQPVLGPGRKADQQIDRQCKHVEQRECRDHHVVAVSVEHVREKSARLHDVGDQVAVRQGSTFRGPCGAAGVLQEEQVITRQVNRCEVQRVALTQGVTETCQRN